ncbi:MAG: modA [Firmicutes bacterium]|nr:modA [Bacillota bacterium]
MKKRNFVMALCSLCLMLLVLAAGCGNSAEKKEAAAPAKEKVEIFVSAAASLTDVMKEIAQMYEKENPNVKLTFSFGASGALQTAIEQGAPSDIFLSAAQKQMDALDKGGLLADGTKKDLLINKVVLITPKDSKAGIADFKDVMSEKVKRIALGEPKGVPVGQYSEEIFTSLNGLDQVKAKAVYGSDVRQVLTWVESGEVDCGIVYATDAATSKKITVVAEAPAGSHKPVVYPASALKSSKNLEQAKAFLDYLSKPEVGKVFEKYGFQLK